jgi:hypothetical protein
MQAAGSRLGVLFSLILTTTSLLGAGASAAQAQPKWLLSPPGNEIGPGLPTEISIEADTSLTLSTRVLGIAVTLVCEKAAASEAFLEAEGKGAGKILFSGCQTLLNGSPAPECEPHSAGKPVGTVLTNALSDQVIAHEGGSLVQVKPSEGDTLANVNQGEECPTGETFRSAAPSMQRTPMAGSKSWNPPTPSRRGR